MGNRQAASAGKPVTFDGQAEITRKLPELPVDHGMEFAALGKLFDTVGSEIGAMADHAAKVEGAAAGVAEGRQAFAEMRPLALRRDGTIRGDATDRAATSTAEWRALSTFHEGLRQAHEQAQGDPAVFDAAVGKLATSVKTVAGSDPVFGDMLDAKMAAAAEPYRRALSAQRAGRIEEERRSAADEAMAATEQDLARKAYLAGSDPASSKALETDVSHARAAVSAAEAEGVIPPAEAARRRKSLGDQVVEARLRGVFDALPDAASKTAWVDGLEKRWAEGDPALGALDRSRVEGLMTHMRGAARADTADQRLRSALDRKVLEHGLADDVASIRASGQPAAGADQRDDGRVAALLGPVDAAKWADERRAAQDWWSQAGDLGRLSGEEIAARVTSLEPIPGAADYARKARLHDEAKKEADRILKMRATDPARAVDDAVKGVREAKAALDPGRPDTFERWVSMRMSAQAALGIPEAAQQPLTDAEARAIMAPVTKAAPGQEWTAFQSVAADVAKRYGSRSEAVTRQLLQVHGVDKDTARAGSLFMDRMQRGEATPADAARVDVATQTSAADRAMAPTPPPTIARPIPGRAIEMLKARPDLAGAFDEKYGAGLSKLYLEDKSAGQGGTP